MKNLIVISSIICVMFGGGSAKANLLIDPGFETNPLANAGANIISDISPAQGVWAVIAATITGVDGGITPAQGSKMLRVVDADSFSQFQATDVTPYATGIDSGSATVNASGLFNVDTTLQSAFGGVYVYFFTAYNAGMYFDFTGNFVFLDSNPDTWQTASTSYIIPVGTRWLLTQVFYNGSSLQGQDGNWYPGYIDATELNIVPEPATLCLLGFGIQTMIRKRPKQKNMRD